MAHNGNKKAPTKSATKRVGTHLDETGLSSIIISSHRQITNIKECAKDPLKFFKENITCVNNFKNLITATFVEDGDFCEKWEERYEKSLSDSLLDVVQPLAKDYSNINFAKKIVSISEILTENSELPDDVNLVNENANVISVFAKKFCMVHHESGESIWDDVAYCWSLKAKEGNSLFFYALVLVLKKVKDKDLVDLFTKNHDQIDLILMAYLCDSVGVNLYKYQCLSPADCIDIYNNNQEVDIDKRMKEIEEGTVKTIIQPGSSFLFKYAVHGKDHKTPFIIGVFGKRAFPFVTHSTMKVDISQMVVFRIKVEGGHASYESTNASNQKKMSSPFILKNLSPSASTFTKDVDYQLCSISNHDLRLLSAIPLPFKRMNAGSLASKYNDRLQEFGASVFRAFDYDCYKPIILKPDETVKIEFKEQIVTRIQQGVYTAAQCDIFLLSAESAKEAGIKKLSRLGPRGKLEDFIRETNVAFPQGWDGAKLKNGSMYLYAHGKCCPFISDWKENEKILLSIKTSSLQEAFKFDAIEGITTHHYYISFANSFFVVHVEDRGLNAANFLLIGVKFWIVIPKRHFPKFMLWLQKKVGHDDMTRCRAWFMHKILFLDPLIIPQEFDLTFIIQRAGDLVVLDNLAVHWGWNVEFNVAFSFNFSCNPNWDTVQHFLPVCQFDDKLNCSVPGLNAEQLMVIRMHDQLLPSTQIPTGHISNPYYNHYSCGWKNLFPDALTVEMDSPAMDVDLEDDTPKSPSSRTSQPNEVSSQQSIASPPSKKRKKKTGRIAPRMKPRKVKSYNPVKCLYCPSRLKDTTGLRSHISKYHPDKTINFSVTEYGREQEKKWAETQAKQNKIQQSNTRPNESSDEEVTHGFLQKNKTLPTKPLDTTDDSSDGIDEDYAKTRQRYKRKRKFKKI